MVAPPFKAIPAVDLAWALLLRRLGCRSYPVQLDLRRLNPLVTPLAFFSGGYFHTKAKN